MKNILNKISKVLSTIFGIGIVIALFVGGLTFFGYLVALIIGGNAATVICDFIYNSIIPVIIKISTIMVLLGLVVMYLKGEVALTSNKKKQTEHDGEM